MEELIEWLIDIEGLASRVYWKAAQHLKDDEEFAGFTRRLSAEEKRHYELMLKARGLVKTQKTPHPPDISLPEDLIHEIEKHFLSSEEKIEAEDFTKEDLINLIVTTEFSEWNDVFMYVANTLKHEFGEFISAAAAIQHHKLGVLHFLASRPEYAENRKKIKLLPDVWREKLLVVDDDTGTNDLLTAILTDAGAVDSAFNGAEGLERLGKHYYAAIVTDFNMPLMNGKDFYAEAVRRYPNIKERFLFFTAAEDADLNDFFNKENIKHLQKPSPIQDIKKAVLEIICRQH